jgi:hypothetical protein
MCPQRSPRFRAFGAIIPGRRSNGEFGYLNEHYDKSVIQARVQVDGVAELAAWGMVNLAYSYSDGPAYSVRADKWPDLKARSVRVPCPPIPQAQQLLERGT